MQEYPLSDQILDALEIAYILAHGPGSHEGFQAWLREHAWLDHLDGGDRFLFHGEELVRDALNGIEKGVFSPPKGDRLLLMVAQQTFRAMAVAREIAAHWGTPQSFLSVQQH